ncbi:NifB/NifX family molybdenum-iron cluster-binding protein [Saccharicrinis sp. FJH62]|uniref:NifB/NifX family molybdenum-iron cluster-binding protein n=1 Tax=Saccharicrinis sp. FJH62 TaxID=3344657 RepID=UPI0035D4DFB9
MKRIAIPIQDNRLSSKYGTCDFLTVYATEGRKVVGKETLLPVTGSTEEIATQLNAMGIGIVITNFIEPGIIGYLAQHKIQVFIGVKNSDPDVLVRQYLDGQLTSDQKVMHLYNN